MKNAYNKTYLTQDPKIFQILLQSTTLVYRMHTLSLKITHECIIVKADRTSRNESLRVLKILLFSRCSRVGWAGEGEFLLGIILSCDQIIHSQVKIDARKLV